MPLRVGIAPGQVGELLTVDRERLRRDTRAETVRSTQMGEQGLFGRASASPSSYHRPEASDMVSGKRSKMTRA